jgi:hypothetical protein
MKRVPQGCSLALLSLEMVDLSSRSFFVFGLILGFLIDFNVV